MNKIKTKIVKQLLDSGLLKPFDVVEHSYTDNGSRDLSRLIISTNGILPAMTTRPDTMGVVVEYE